MQNVKTILGLCVGLTACQPETIVEMTEAPNDTFGRVYIPLTVESSSGNLYLLEFSSLEIVGEYESTTFTLDGSGEFDISLAVGAYDLIVNDYTVYREDNGEWNQVGADLVSDNPQSFVIEAYNTTHVSLDFSVWAQDESEDVTFEGGDLEIEITITDDEAPECTEEIVYTYEEDVNVTDADIEYLICEDSCDVNGMLYTGQSFVDTAVGISNVSCRCITECEDEMSLGLGLSKALSVE